jgi:hypothetical protein
MQFGDSARPIRVSGHFSPSFYRQFYTKGHGLTKDAISVSAVPLRTAIAARNIRGSRIMAQLLLLQMLFYSLLLDIDSHQHGKARRRAAHQLGRRNHGNMTYRLCVAAVIVCIVAQ